MTTAQTAAPAAAPTPAVEAKTEAPKTEAPKVEAKVEAPKPDAEKPVEAKPEAPKPEEKKEDTKVAKSFAQLAKKERELVTAQKKFAAERAEAQKLIASLQADAKKVDDFQRMLQSAKKDPVKVLKEVFGLTYDDFSQIVLNDGKLSPEQQTKAEIEEAKTEARRAAEELKLFRKQQAEAAEAAKRSEHERMKQEETSLRDAFYRDGVAFVQTNVADYELISLNGAEAEVPRLIELTYEQSGRTLSFKEAAEQVESFLQERLEKATSSQKWQRLMAEKTKAAQPPAPIPPAPVAPDTRTLTNSTAPAASKPSTKPSSNETEEQRIRRAVAAFNKARGG